MEPTGGGIKQKSEKNKKGQENMQKGCIHFVNDIYSLYI